MNKKIEQLNGLKSAHEREKELRGERRVNADRFGYKIQIELKTFVTMMRREKICV